MSKKEELFLQIEEIENQIKKIRAEHSQLKKHPKVEKFIELEKKIDQISSQKHHLRILYQQHLYEKCEHPLWYFMKSKSDFIKGDIYWTCKCIKCGHVEREKNYFFWNKVILQSVIFGHGRKSVHSYTEVANAFKETNEEENILIKKFNSK